jgi:hypothetical protein
MTPSRTWRAATPAPLTPEERERLRARLWAAQEFEPDPLVSP